MPARTSDWADSRNSGATEAKQDAVQPGTSAGAASGFNSAVARTAGLMATALLGSVLGAGGLALTTGFQATMVACAIASVGAAVSAYLMIRAK